MKFALFTVAAVLFSNVEAIKINDIKFLLKGHPPTAIDMVTPE